MADELYLLELTQNIPGTPNRASLSFVMQTFLGWTATKFDREFPTIGKTYFP